MPSSSTLHASCLAPSAPADTPTPPHVLPRYSRLDSSPLWHPHPRAATGAISTTLSVPLHPCTFDGPVLLVGVGDHTSTCSCMRLQTWTNASSPAHSYHSAWLAPLLPALSMVTAIELCDLLCPSAQLPSLGVCLNCSTTMVILSLLNAALKTHHATPDSLTSQRSA